MTRLALVVLVGVAACSSNPTAQSSADAGVTPVRSCTTDFLYKGNGGTVTVAGEWNAFSATATPMTKDQAGAWHASLMLAPGSYAYKLVVDGTYELDPGNPYYEKYVAGIENSAVEVEDCGLPQMSFAALDVSATGALFAQAQYVDGSGMHGIDPSTLTVTLDGTPIAGAAADASGLITISTSGLATDKHRLVLSAKDQAGNATNTLQIPFWVEPTAFDFRDGMMYFAFTDRFKNGDPSNDSLVPNVDARANYQGGDFAGIQQAIEAGYFDKLGARSIWISPPYANPEEGWPGTDGHQYTGYHGYWPIASTTIEKRFGDLAALKSMVAAAHKHGIRILVDSVLHHVHTDDPYWVQYQNDSWFTATGCVCGVGSCDWTIDATTCWFDTYLPTVDYLNFDVLKQMIDDALYWADVADVDGYRVDAAKQFPIAVIRRLRGKLHDQYEHGRSLYYLVGETYEGSDDGSRAYIATFLGPNQLTAQFDFPLYWNIINAFALQNENLSDLDAAAHSGDNYYGTAPMSPFMGNQDVPRFLSTAANMLDADPKAQAWSDPPGLPSTDAPYAQQRLALTFLYTQPGVPLIYYGDEYGQPGANDPDNRRFMKWEGLTSSEQATLAHAQALGSARVELEGLRHGNRVTLWVDNDFYVYARATASSAAIVAINRATTAQTQTVLLQSSVPLADGTVLRDRLGGPSVTVQGGQMIITLAPQTSAVLAP